MMLKVTYYYSACVTIETPDIRILCDPWFTEGAFDGSWYQYPKLESPVKTIGKCDVVYISHIHPDHYDREFLREYLATYPDSKVVIGAYPLNFLSLRMTRDLIPHIPITEELFGETRIHIIADPSQNAINSALAVSHGGQCVLNLNDCQFIPEHMDEIVAVCAAPEIALIAYTGAGPYPQAFEMPEHERILKATEKKQQFFAQYTRVQAAVHPKVTIPFAGKYVLGGKLHRLNRHRGVADAVEVTEFDPTAVVLADGGHASIDTTTLVPTAIRTERYPDSAIDAYALTTAERSMDFERILGDLPMADLPLERLLGKAYRNAISRSESETDHYFCADLTPNGWFVGNTNKNRPFFKVYESVTDLTPRTEITIDLRYLFGLVTTLFHWNNAEVGSQLWVRRVPDVYDRPARRFANFFHV
jgi:UDP-MurNAc hydroxylase